MSSGEESFGGRAGDVVARAVSPVSLITGVLLAVILAAVTFALSKVGASRLAPLGGAFVVAAFLARSAVDAYEARWSAGRGVPFSDFVPVALRYLALQAVLIVPLIVIGWRPEVVAPLFLAAGGETAGAVGGLLIVLFYAGCIVIAPPLLLIVAVAAREFRDIVTPAHWGRCFAARGSDVFLIYVLYAGSMLAVIVLCLPLVGGVGIVQPRALAFFIPLCGLLAAGTAIVLLGQLCGEFARPLRPEAPRTKIIASTPAAAGSGFEKVAVSTSTARLNIAQAPAQAAVPRPPTVARPSAPPVAEEAPQTPPGRKPPLLDGPKRVEEIVRASGGNVAQAVPALEQLREEFAPNATVLHALTIAYTRGGRREEAVNVAREAIPLCVRSGSVVLAAEIVAVLRDSLDAAGITAEQAIGFAETLRNAKRLPHAAALYGTLLAIRPVNSRAMKGALQTAQEIVASGDAKASLGLYEKLVECSSGTPLAEFVRDGREAAMKKAGGR